MEPFTREDVEHLDTLIAAAIEETPGTTALPGAEAARNKIAVRVGLEPAPEGGITWERIRETDYSDLEGDAVDSPDARREAWEGLNRMRKAASRRGSALSHQEADSIAHHIAQFVEGS